MDRKIIEIDMIKNSKVFDDCRSYSFINLMQYHGLTFTIDELLGFGGGITFDLINVSNNKLPLYYPCGKKSDELTICCKKFGIDAIMSQFDCTIKQEEMFAEISKLIDEGFPVVLNADRFYLDYLQIPKGHIGLHTILIYGYARNKLEFYVGDMFSEKIYETASIEMIYKAVMEEKQIPTERKYYYIKNRYDGKIAKEKVYEEVLREHCSNALGDNGYLRSFTEYISNLHDLQSQGSENRLIDKYLDKQLTILINAIKMLENSGTFYRSTYCKFIVKLLKELEYSNETINEITEIFEDIYGNIANCTMSLSLGDKIGFLERFVLLETKLFSKLEALHNSRC